MAKNKPVLDFSGFVNENKMKIINSSKLKHSWDPNHPSNNDGIPQVDAKTNNTPLLNLLEEYGYTIIADYYSGNRFGKQCEDIRIGNDLTKRLVYVITIRKIYTEEFLVDEYGADWEGDSEAVKLLGKPVGGNEFTFNFFTDFTNNTQRPFFEEALTYAQYYYRLYKELNIHATDYYELLREDDNVILNYMNKTGINIKNNNDSLQLKTAAFRAYHDHKAIYQAEEGDNDPFFSRDFLQKFISL